MLQQLDAFCQILGAARKRIGGSKQADEDLGLEAGSGSVVGRGPLRTFEMLGSKNLTSLGIWPGRNWKLFWMYWYRPGVAFAAALLPGNGVVLVASPLPARVSWIATVGRWRPNAVEAHSPVPLAVSVLALATLSTSWDVPALRGFNYRGGFVLVPEFVALFAALTTYTAAFIAEIVRGGILAVPKGQLEAAAAGGLRPSQTLRLVVIPQALRVMIPPLTNQYLNVLKNSSLGGAIGFPELMNVFVGSALNITGQAVEIIAITLAIYLAIGLAVSALMNWYNARVALVTQ